MILIWCRPRQPHSVDRNHRARGQLALCDRMGPRVIDVDPPRLADIHRSRTARVGEALHAVGQASALASGNGRLDRLCEFGRGKECPAIDRVVIGERLADRLDPPIGIGLDPGGVFGIDQRAGGASVDREGDAADRKSGV